METVKLDATVTRLVGGVGVYVKGKYSCTSGGVTTKEYAIWQRLIQRAYNYEFHKRSPTYVGCSMSENFKNFQFFAEWCNGQVGFGNKGWHLDKDILLKGNKEYSESFVCSFPLN